MKRKTMPVRPRNPFVVPAKFRKAGAHGKTEKATRREAKIDLRECSLVARHPAFTRTKDEFEPLRSHHRLHTHADRNGAQRW